MNRQLHDWTAELFAFYGQSLDDPLVMQRFGQMCRAAANDLARWLKERKDTDVTPANLPLLDSLDPSAIRTPVGEAHRRRHQHQESDIQRTAGLLLRQKQQREKERRPPGGYGGSPKGADATCAVKDTAHETDICTCSHMRANHTGSGAWPRSCSLCYCPAFTKESLTIFDELRERRTP